MRTPRGTPAVAKGYAGKENNYCRPYKIFFVKTDNTSTFLLIAIPVLSYSIFFTEQQ